MSLFNEEQDKHMAYLCSIPPEMKCWCGWYLLGEFNNKYHACPPDKTCADKMALACPDCGNTPHWAPGSKLNHTIVCSKL